MKKNKWLTIRVSDKFIQKLNDLCEENERTKTSQIEELVKEKWDKTHKK